MALFLESIDQEIIRIKIINLGKVIIQNFLASLLQAEKWEIS